MPGGKRHLKHVTIVDVARKSGFAPSTVSIVLNSAPLSRRVPEHTKAHIRETAEALGYRPNIFARALVSRRSQTIGIMIFDISDPFCVLALDGIQKTLSSTSYLPIMMDARGDRQRFEGYLRMLVDYRVEALIVVANWLMGESQLFLDIKNDVPIVMIGRDFSKNGIFSMSSDNETGGYMAIQHLYELGHRKIAVIRGPKKMVDGSLRWKGIQRFAKKHDLTIDMRRVRQLPDSWDAKSSFACGQKLTEDLLQSSLRFTALVAFDDLTALGAVRALNRASLSVPGDCSVVGYDDVPPAALSTPGLTTIHQPLEEIGILTTEYILKVLVGESDIVTESRLRTLPPSLILRDSTRKLSR